MGKNNHTNSCRSGEDQVCICWKPLSWRLAHSKASLPNDCLCLSVNVCALHLCLSFHPYNGLCLGASSLTRNFPRAGTLSPLCRMLWSGFGSWPGARRPGWILVLGHFLPLSLDFSIYKLKRFDQVIYMILLNENILWFSSHRLEATWRQRNCGPFCLEYLLPPAQCLNTALQVHNHLSAQYLCSAWLSREIEGRESSPIPQDSYSPSFPLWTHGEDSTSKHENMEDAWFGPWCLSLGGI